MVNVVYNLNVPHCCGTFIYNGWSMVKLKQLFTVGGGSDDDYYYGIGYHDDDGGEDDGKWYLVNLQWCHSQ